MKAIAFALVFLIVSSTYASSSMRVSNVLAQVQSLLQTGGPAAAVFDLLDGISQGVRDEQRAHDELHAKHVAQCDAETSFREGQIEQANDAIRRASAQRDQCATSASRAELTLENNRQAQDDTRAAIAEKIAQRAREANAFAARVAQRDEGLAAIDEALILVDDLVTGHTYLIQLARHSAKMLRQAVQARQTAIYAPVIAAFAELSTSDVNAGDAERLRELLNNVRDQVNAAHDAYATAESNAIDAFNQTKATLEAQLADLEEEERTLNTHLSEMSLCATEETAVIEEASAKLARNSQLLDDARALCSTYYDQYNTATEARNDELRILAELRAVVEQRFGQFSAGVYARGDADEFAAYENKSEYHEDHFVKQGGDFNAGGAEQVAYNRDAELERLI